MKLKAISGNPNQSRYAFIECGKSLSIYKLNYFLRFSRRKTISIEHEQSRVKFNLGFSTSN